jgi:NAD(P)-dependent dehydrogenase (short-subunit alcohol dehydrogenase family)
VSTVTPSSFGAATGKMSLLMDETPKILSGKNALVIGGGGGGIGRAITQGLAAAGSAVAVADLERDRANEAAAEIAAAGGQSFSLAGDVRSPKDIDGFLSSAAQELGGLDVLVTVVGGQLAFVPPTPPHGTTDEDWISCSTSTFVTWPGPSEPGWLTPADALATRHRPS